MSTRAGLMQIPKTHSYHRTGACLAPSRYVAVDYNGKGMLCFQTRSDAPQHQNAVIGDLTHPGYSIFCFYRDLGSARAGLVAPGLKGGFCDSCDVSTPSPDRLARRPAIASAMRVLGIGRVVGRAVSAQTRKYE